MKIEKIELGEVTIPLITPFKTALRTVETVEDVVVLIRTDTGNTGYGEAPATAGRLSLPPRIFGAMWNSTRSTACAARTEAASPPPPSIKRSIISRFPKPRRKLSHAAASGRSTASIRPSG